MAFGTVNTISASDVNVLGLIIYFRVRARLAADASTSDTTITLDSAAMLRAGDTIELSDGTDSESATIDAVSGNTITLEDGLTNSYSAGSMVMLSNWYDLGHVQNPARTVDQQEQDIQSARTGKLLTIKKLTTSLSKGLTFESMSTTDSVILALHRGRTPGAAVPNTGVFVPDDVTPVMGELLIVQHNAETGGPIRLEYRPAAQIRGVDESGGDGTNPALLNFEATFLQAEGYQIPATLASDTPDAPLGFAGVTTSANLPTVLDAISDQDL